MGAEDLHSRAVFGLGAQELKCMVDDVVQLLLMLEYFNHFHVVVETYSLVF